VAYLTPWHPSRQFDGPARGIRNDQHHLLSVECSADSVMQARRLGIDPGSCRRRPRQLVAGAQQFRSEKVQSDQSTRSRMLSSPHSAANSSWWTLALSRARTSPRQITTSTL
jgi:hypothetical protein